MVGIAGNITQKQKDAFRTLLVIDTLRGPHSTGVASVDKDGTWMCVKKKGNAWDLFDSREYTSMMTYSTYCLIGHNRYATKGKINNINAHPFEFEHVVGAHNGTIRGQHRLIDHAQFEVDSENIYHSINQIGLDETLDVLDGAYALTYWDKRTEEFVLLRNKERTLYYTMSPDNQTVYWASEAWMLSVALSRAGLKHGEIVDVRPCNIYRFKIDRTLVKPEPIQVSIQAFVEYKAPLPAAYGGGGKGAGFPKQGGSTKKAEGSGNLPDTKGLVGAVAEFTIDGHRQNAYRQWYVAGRLKEFPEVEVRVFAHVGGDLWNRLTLCYDSCWEGKISSFSKYGDALFVQMTPATVVEIIDEEDDEEEDDTVLGYNDKLLTEATFRTATRNGCAWCCGSVTMLDAKYIHWVDHTTFVCADCQELDEVKDHIKVA